MVHWIVPGQVGQAAVRSGPRTGTVRPWVRSGGKGRRRPAAAASRPAWASPARPPAVSWPWPCGSETRSWPGSLWGWGSWRTPLSPRWRGTVSDGTSSPERAAARLWREFWVSCCSCVSVGCRGAGWAVLEIDLQSHKIRMENVWSLWTNVVNLSVWHFQRAWFKVRPDRENTKKNSFYIQCVDSLENPGTGLHCWRVESSAYLSE